MIQKYIQFHQWIFNCLRESKKAQCSLYYSILNIFEKFCFLSFLGCHWSRILSHSECLLHQEFIFWINFCNLQSFIWGQSNFYSFHPLIFQNLEYLLYNFQFQFYSIYQVLMGMHLIIRLFHLINSRCIEWTLVLKKE